MPEFYHGYEVRDTHPSEEAYFKENPSVAGMATEDGKIILNKHSGLSDKQRRAVAENEAIRLFLRDNHIRPTFVATPDQLKSFEGTSYADPKNRLDLKHTLLARILTEDPSAGKVTSEQRSWANIVRKELSISAGNHRA